MMTGIRLKFSNSTFLTILIFIKISSLTASPNLSKNPKKEDSVIVKKNESTPYYKLKLQFPFDSVVQTVHSQKSYLKIFPVKDEQFFLTIRNYNEIPSFENPQLSSLEKSFLPNAIYHPSMEFNFVKSYRIKKWSAEFIKNGNELNAIVYLVNKENEFYTIWIVYRKYNTALDSVFQKVDFFTAN